MNFLEWKDHLIVFSNTYFKKSDSYMSSNDNLFFLPPIGPSPSKMINELYEEIRGMEVHRCPIELANEFRAQPMFSHYNLTVYDDRNNWDYVYDKDDLISLTGNKYYQKRKRLKRFIQNQKRMVAMVLPFCQNLFLHQVYPA